MMDIFSMKLSWLFCSWILLWAQFLLGKYDRGTYHLLSSYTKALDRIVWRDTLDGSFVAKPAW